MHLSDLHTGERGVIVKVQGHGGFRKRIIEMGFVKGKIVEVQLNAPLNDPIKYKLMGYEVSLRRQEAERIEVISEKEALLHKKELTAYYGSSTDPDQLDQEELMNRLAQKRQHHITIALIGNPNCGKTSLFNIASGAHEHVGNYSGVTVDATEGTVRFEGYHIRLIDLPGTYSLSAYTAEELYVRNYLTNETPDIVINVVDASNLERNLYLTTQLIDMNMNVVMALNMYDELEKSGNKLDNQLLGKLLGMPIVPTNCRQSVGIKELLQTAIQVYETINKTESPCATDTDCKERPEKCRSHRSHRHERRRENRANRANRAKSSTSPSSPSSRHIHINHGPLIEKAIDRIKKEISRNENIRHKYSTRNLSIKLLEMDKETERLVHTLPNHKNVLKVRDEMAATLFDTTHEESDTAITNAKYGFINGALKETFINGEIETRQVTKVLDSIFTHKLWGYPLFFCMMYAMFQATFSLGQYPMDWIDGGVAALSNLLQNNMTDGALKDLLVDGIVGGVGSVIVFLPNILILYFCISLMEDSGYMARAAFIMDKVMHKIGLHGKSFIPLIMGFGCNVPAIMASRTIENKKSRLITILINPLMSCSARLPIYLMLVSAFFPNHGSLVIMSVFLVGILLAAIIARIFHRFIVTGDDIPFVMELPPYRLPTMRSIVRHTWEKGEQYLRKMGGIILLASIIIWFLTYFPRPEVATAPTVAQTEQVSPISVQDSTALAQAATLQQQENSYIGRIGQAIEPVLRPLGFDWKMGVALITGAGAKELVVSTISVLYPEERGSNTTSLSQRLPFTPVTAYGFMIFTLLYFPCIATLAAIKQESGSWKWAVFAATYTTLLAWVMSFLVYNIGNLF